ncbi:MAG: acyl dehydratase [Limisphaerales bacterium]
MRFSAGSQHVEDKETFVNQESGPGTLKTDDVGTRTIAKTTMLATRVAMAYAAGINDTNPIYFDDLRAGGVAVHPCIAFSLQWAARFRPDQELNVRAAPFGVHASTDLRIHRPFYTGEAITTQGEMIGKRQLTPGVYNVERYRMTASNGELVAELYYNGITRGATLEGDDRFVEQEPAWPEVGVVTAGPMWQKSVAVDLHAGQQYTECARIFNPIHTEPSVAKKAGLPGVILHGSATKAMSLTAVVDGCFAGDPNRITRLCGQLRAMVLMGTTITVEALAEEVIDGEKRVQFRCLNDVGETAIANGVVCGTA